MTRSIMCVAIAVSTLGCVTCLDEEVSATFTLSDSELDSLSGGSGALTFEQCASYCEEALLTAYPDVEAPQRCELLDSSDAYTYECAWTSDATCA